MLDGGRVAWAGPRASAPQSAQTRVDAGGRTVVPGFVDSHGHLVFAGDRSEEFAAHMAGQPYAAGGIRTTVAATRAATTEQLSARTGALVEEARRSGTTTLESKTGYGLTVEDEQRSAEVAARHVEEVTFLGAHVVPPEFTGRADDYVARVCTEMLHASEPITWSGPSLGCRTGTSAQISSALLRSSTNVPCEAGTAARDW